MGQFHWDPGSYLELMRSEVPDYERLQDEVARACATVDVAGPVAEALELGTGTGETARRVLAVLPEARLTGIDASERMLAVAREALVGGRQTVDLRCGRLDDPLPEGRFELVFSALAVHHLDGPGKAALFRRVSEALVTGGRFVLGDVVIPVDPADALTPIDDDGYDKPSTVADQLTRLDAAGFDARVVWSRRDLAVLTGDRA
jgi:tRNA (cmo5U34)-methyltransferase